MRTVPVGRSITPAMEVMAYETAEELVRAQKRFSVAPCICRKEKSLTGQSCDKPLEVCMAFGTGADYYQRNGQGRAITKEEALAILTRADEAGLVLQPGNAKEAMFICACCGDCCGVLTTLKRYPKPGTLVSSPFVAAYERRHLPGLRRLRGPLPDGGAATGGRRGCVLDVDRCIGCGLCVSTCPSESLTLVRKPESEQRAGAQGHPGGDRSAWGRHAGRWAIAELMGIQVRSTVDRMLSDAEVGSPDTASRGGSRRAADEAPHIWMGGPMWPPGGRR